MTASFYNIRTTAHFDRLVKKLVPRHADLVERLEEAVEILSIDPCNKSHNYPIKKLQGVPAGDGQYRLRSGRFRFRYDISVKEVVLHYCGLRREDTY